MRRSRLHLSASAHAVSSLTPRLGEWTSSGKGVWTRRGIALGRRSNIQYRSRARWARGGSACSQIDPRAIPERMTVEQLIASGLVASHLVANQGHEPGIDERRARQKSGGELR